MKDKENINFYYSTFRIYEKDLNDALVEDYLTSDKKDKTKYLSELIILGLRAKQRNALLTTKIDEDTILNRFSVIEQTLGAMQKENALENVKNEIFRKAICNIYYYSYFTMFNDQVDEETIKAGFWDSLPDRLQSQLDKSMRTLNGA